MASISNPSKQITKPQSFRGNNRKSQEKDLSEIIEENKKLESELHLTLEEIAHLQNALANVSMKLAVYKNTSTENIPPDKNALVSVNEDLIEIYVPINTIANYCELLLSQSVGTLGKLQQKFVERIDDSANQIHEMLDEIQRKSRSGERPLLLTKGRVDILSAIEHSLFDNSKLLREKQIVLQMEVPENLPKIHGEKTKIRNIIETIILNALLITPTDGSICISAYAEEMSSAPRVVLKVRDGGPGIHETDLRLLSTFDKDFYPEKIAGLGLNANQFILLSEMLEEQGCPLKITNAPDFGGSFEVTFNTND